MSQPNRSTVAGALALLAAADRQSWSLLTGHRDLCQVAERLRRVRELPRLPDIRHLDVPADRVPVVVAHGPGFSDVIADLVANRNRVWLIAPFRSALRLIDADVVPDVILLADRDTWPVASSLEQWRQLPAAHSRRLRAAALVVDAFAPAEIVMQFSRVYSFDCGLGCGTTLPLHGIGVLAAVSLSLVLGHRHLGVTGADLSSRTRLGSLLAALGETDDVLCVDVGTSGLSACLESGPLLAAREPALKSGLSPVACARAAGVRELDHLAERLDDVRRGLSSGTHDRWLAVLVADIRSRWRLNPAVVAAVERAEMRWVSEAWALDAMGMPPIDTTRSTQMIAGLVLHDLALALERHVRDCRECLDGNLGVAEAAA